MTPLASPKEKFFTALLILLIATALATASCYVITDIINSLTTGEMRVVLSKYRARKISYDNNTTEFVWRIITGSTFWLSTPLLMLTMGILQTWAPPAKRSIADKISVLATLAFTGFLLSSFAYVVISFWYS